MQSSSSFNWLKILVTLEARKEKKKEKARTLKHQFFRYNESHISLTVSNSLYSD